MDVITALRQGVLSSAELENVLDVSPPTLMRRVREAGPDVIRIGLGRATRYGVRQQWSGLNDSRFPIFRISEAGAVERAGELLTLLARQTVWMPEGRVSTGLPIEIADARPSGFLGRHFAATHADLRLPPRLQDWSDHHILLAMSRRGEDLPSNLIIGDESFERWQRLGTPSHTQDDYPALAEATIAGHPPGSSAGGERPKFGVVVGGRHMLVKFAACTTANDVVARRWCDLLVLEALALELVSSRGVDAAATQIVQTPSHYFLQSERFDRVGVRGRVAVLSLAALHDDPSDTWARAAAALQRSGRLTETDARRLRWLDAFGAFIANTDRHQYNVLFFPRQRRFHLAPAFDQVSMLYAPSADGQVPRRDFSVPTSTGDTLDVWEEARSAGLEFWQRGASDQRLSDEMRAICDQNAAVLSETAGARSSR